MSCHISKWLGGMKGPVVFVEQLEYLFGRAGHLALPGGCGVSSLDGHSTESRK